MPEDFTPVMTQLSAADLATLDTLITAGIVNSRTEGVRWAVGRLREHRLHPAPAADIRERRTQDQF
jgi:hypothetical protein